ncbi:MAG TPA: hypothetical protein VGM81_10150 [Burkholderiaceae bacterium]|jgi:hypothetical protein
MLRLLHRTLAAMVTAACALPASAQTGAPVIPRIGELTRVISYDHKDMP